MSHRIGRNCACNRGREDGVGEGGVHIAAEQHGLALLRGLFHLPYKQQHRLAARHLPHVIEVGVEVVDDTLGALVLEHGFRDGAAADSIPSKGNGVWRFAQPQCTFL